MPVAGACGAGSINAVLGSVWVTVSVTSKVNSIFSAAGGVSSLFSDGSKLKSRLGAGISSDLVSVWFEPTSRLDRSKFNSGLLSTVFVSSTAGEVVLGSKLNENSSGCCCCFVSTGSATGLGSALSFCSKEKLKSRG